MTTINPDAPATLRQVAVMLSTALTRAGFHYSTAFLDEIAAELRGGK